MTELLAPNGKPSNLTPEQYKLVRTPKFKDWFGDWENLALTKLNDSGIDEVSLKRLSDSVSKIVDENGEPMVVYHRTNENFTIFDKNKSGTKTDTGYFGKGFYFSKNESRVVYGQKIIKVFLNAKNPKYTYSYNLEPDNKLDTIVLRGEYDFVNNKKLLAEEVNEIQEIVVFEPNQIKLADGTNTTFDENNPDIRFEKGGLLAPNGNPSNLSPEQYKLVRTPEFKEWFGDWENSPETSSKIVDENGEPLVVYRGDDKERGNIFITGEKAFKGSTGNVNLKYLYFTDSYESAKSFGKIVKPYFINSKENLDLRVYFKDVVSSESELKKYLDKIKIKNTLSDNNSKYHLWGLVKYFEDGLYEKYNGFWFKDSSVIKGQNSLVVFEPNQIKLADGTNTTFDENNPDIRFEKGGLLAPNGNPSNLSPEQYKLVRTSEFKDWFGDWENSPETSSKIVDENGEPLVLYHGTRNRFSVFDIGKSGESNTVAKIGFWFTPIKSFAHDFSHNSWYGKDEVIVYPVFLSIKQPKVFKSEEIRYGDSYQKLRTDIYEIAGQNEGDANIGGLGMSLNNPKETIEKYRIKLNEDGFDGVIIENTRFDIKEAGGLNDQYVALYPNQIKLADGTNTTFDGSNPDIRFKEGGVTIAQTPAPKKDQIYGSEKNKEGSSKDLKSAKKIELSDKTIEAIKNKVDKHNEKHPNKKITIDSAKAVVRRGMGAYSSSHRPTIKGGNPNSRVAWGLARLNAFLYKIVNGKSKSGKYSQDNDLIEELGYEFEKYDEGGDIKAKIIYPNTQSAYDIQAQKFIVDFLKKSKVKQLVKNSDDKGNYEIYVVYDKLYPNESKFYITDSIQKAYQTALNLDVAELNIVKAKNDKDSNTLVYDYYNGDLFGNYLGEKYDEKGNLKEEVKSEAINQMNKHFNRDWYSDGGEISDTMRNEIIDILSKNKRYGEGIFSIQEIGIDIIEKCIESNTYFGDAIKQAYENYIMIPISYEDKLFAIDKKVEYGYFSKPNGTTNLKIEYRHDLKEYPFPILFDSELIDNTDFNDINEYEEIKSNEFDSEFLYRGINSEEMKSIIENGFIKSNASLNIGEQQAETTSYAQYISQAGSYAVGFNAWYDEVTFPKPKYILKVKKEGVNFKPTNEGDIHGEVDVFGEVPIEKIDSIYEIRLGQCSMGTVEINVNYKGEYSEGSRFPMMKKVFVRKTDITTLIENYNNQNNNTMTNSNPKDTITMDIPLLIRFAELMREDIKTDVALHEVIENLIEIKDKGVLTMGDYESIVGNVVGAEEPKTEEPKMEEPKMEEGGKVQSIHSQKGDIKISLDENWYSDDTDVELVPVSELIKFREFDRKVSPKYNKENSVDNINHLKFMFQKDGVKSPIIIEYSAEDNAVLIIEGNHRLNSAIDLGMEYLPARVVLRKYGKYSPAKIKNAMKVNGVQADSGNYIPSNLKPSQVGIAGAKPIIYAEGGIIEGRLHSECGEDGCGRKFQVGENGHEIEAERDEAVIVADAFKSDEEITIEGTPSEIASALNVIGGGKNFDKGAKIIEDGEQKELPQMKQEATDTDVDDVIDSGSVIINRRSMADEKEYKVTGSPKQIASAINSINGNGVVIEEGAEIE